MPDAGGRRRPPRGRTLLSFFSVRWMACALSFPPSLTPARFPWRARAIARSSGPLTFYRPKTMSTSPARIMGGKEGDLSTPRMRACGRKKMEVAPPKTVRREPASEDAVRIPGTVRVRKLRVEMYRLRRQHSKKLSRFAGPSISCLDYLDFLSSLFPFPSLPAPSPSISDSRFKIGHVIPSLCRSVLLKFTSGVSPNCLAFFVFLPCGLPRPSRAASWRGPTWSGREGRTTTGSNGPQPETRKEHLGSQVAVSLRPGGGVPSNPSV